MIRMVQWITLTSSRDAYSIVEQDAGNILLENLQDRSFRAALNLAGWRPMGDARAQAVEWYQLDFEYARTPVSIRLTLFSP